MSLETRIISLAQAVGADVKDLTTAQGALASLSTTAKANLVAAINELHAALGATIDDTAGTGDVDVTWSAGKIFDTIALAKAAVKDEILDGAGSALDTLKELADALNNDPSFAATVATDLGKRVRFDAAQVLTGPEQVQARANIGAADGTAVDALVLALGDIDTDFVAAYNTAKA